MNVLHGINGQDLAFNCPGCGCSHFFRISGQPIWSWNGSMDKPTVTPSIRVQGNILCHFFLMNGQFVFCNDCQHELAGKTIPMIPWDTGEVMENENAAPEKPQEDPAVEQAEAAQEATVAEQAEEAHDELVEVVCESCGAHYSKGDTACPNVSNH